MIAGFLLLRAILADGRSLLSLPFGYGQLLRRLGPLPPSFRLCNLNSLLLVACYRFLKLSHLLTVTFLQFFERQRAIRPRHR